MNPKPKIDFIGSAKSNLKSQILFYEKVQAMSKKNDMESNCEDLLDNEINWRKAALECLEEFTTFKKDKGKVEELL